MKNFIGKRLSGFGLLALLFSSASWSVHANDINIYQPEHGGNFRLHLMDAAGKDTLIDVVLNGNETAEQKANIVSAEINRIFNNQTFSRVNPGGGLLHPTIEVDSSITTFRYAWDGTGERHRFTKHADNSNTQTNKETMIAVDYHLFDGVMLDGVDQNGQESIFQASFGFDNVVADASFRFGDLSGNTIDALLIDTYHAFLADLPSMYQGNLSLDLLNDEINFVFPDWSAAGFVETFTSDTNAYASMSMGTNTIPEPSLIHLLSIAAIGMRLAKHYRLSGWA